jgi:hypothetical protein
MDGQVKVYSELETMTTAEIVLAYIHGVLEISRKPT